MIGKFTGWHATGIFVAFFGIVVAVNVTMAFFATSTFGGKLADNGYVASQDYNKWIAAAEAQDRLGWSIEPTIADGHLVIEVEGVKDAKAMVVARHPLGNGEAVDIAMTRISPTQLRSAEPFPAGRWQLQTTLIAQGREARFRDEVRL